MVSEANLAYLAGLFDGDGAIMAFIERHKEKKYGFRVRVTIKITQRNPEILYWINSIFDKGSVVKNRTTYEWIVRDQTDILTILSQLQVFLRIKKEQAKIANKIIKSRIFSYRDLLEVAKLADSLSKFNVRSKGRKKNFSSKVKESIPRND